MNIEDNPLFDTLCEKKDDKYFLSPFGQLVVIAFALSLIIYIINYNYYLGVYIN